MPFLDHFFVADAGRKLPEEVEKILATDAEEFAHSLELLRNTSLHLSLFKIILSDLKPEAAGKVMQLHEPVSAVNDLAELRRRVRELLRDMVPVPGNVDDPGYPTKLAEQLKIRSKIVPHVIAD